VINLYIAKLRNIALIMCADCTKQVDKSFIRAEKEERNLAGYSPL